LESLLTIVIASDLTVKLVELLWCQGFDVFWGNIIALSHHQPNAPQSSGCLTMYSASPLRSLENKSVGSPSGLKNFPPNSFESSVLDDAIDSVIEIRLEAEIQ
jgi:hypothetical protein